MTEMTHSGNARGRASKQEILQEATTLFAEVGFHNASLRDIASRVGMTHPGLLHHFPSKKALLAEVLAYRDEQDLAQMELAVSRDGLSFDLALVQVAADNAAKPGAVALFAVLSAEATSPSHPAHSFFVARYVTLLAELTEFYEELAQAGQLQPGLSAHEAAQAVMALMDGLQIQWLLGLGSKNPALAVNMSEVVDRFVRGLRV